MINENESDPNPPAIHRVAVVDVVGPPVIVPETMTLRAVAGLMIEQQVDNVVVVDVDGVVRGVVTDHQLTLSPRQLRLSAVRVPRVNGQWVTALEEAEAACVAAETMTAGEIVERRLTTAEASEPIGTAVDRMLRQDAKYALVMRDGEVVGVLGRRDLLRLVAGQTQSARVLVPANATLQQPAAHLAAPVRWPMPGWLAQVWR